MTLRTCWTHWLHRLPRFAVYAISRHDRKRINKLKDANGAVTRSASMKPINEMSESTNSKTQNPRLRLKNKERIYESYTILILRPIRP
jgi:hypothetical protein